MMLPFRSNLVALCPTCGAVLPPIRGFVSVVRRDNDPELKFSPPDKVVVMHKTSRFELERRRNKNLSERQLRIEVSIDRPRCAICLQHCDGNFDACA